MAWHCCCKRSWLLYHRKSRKNCNITIIIISSLFQSISRVQSLCLMSREKSDPIYTHATPRHTQSRQSKKSFISSSLVSNKSANSCYTHTHSNRKHDCLFPRLFSLSLCVCFTTSNATIIASSIMTRSHQDAMNGPRVLSSLYYFAYTFYYYHS